MARLTNPFRERKSEQTTSDQEFVRFFSPKILEQLPKEAFFDGVHLFVSPPGGGKTTLFRAFTPAALRGFWSNSKLQAIAESAKTLVEYGVLDAKAGPQILGVSLSCSSGYADLPPGASLENDGLLRALLNCRIVMRTLRSLASVVGVSSPELLSDVSLSYEGDSDQLTCIPRTAQPAQLAAWAEQCERQVYSHLDAVTSRPVEAAPSHVRLEGILWLNGVRFNHGGQVIAPRRLLMIDDFQSLRRRQRELLLKEIVDLRVQCPIWLAQRTAVLGDQLLAPGGREGRDIRVHSLDVIWANAGRAFYSFARNILDRRLEAQDILPKVEFDQFIKEQIGESAVRAQLQKGLEIFREATARYRGDPQYGAWFAKADVDAGQLTLEGMLNLYTTRILIARNEGKRQIALVPLAAEELDEHDSPRGAAEIFLREELGIPYYYGMNRLCTLATNNVEELIALAATLYDSLEAKQMLRRPDVALTAEEQDKLLSESARRKRDFIPRTHEHGTKSQSLLDGIGSFCRERTFVPGASYAPGVTGVRLSRLELERLLGGLGGAPEVLSELKKVLAECVANNLLVPKEIAATTGREGGTAFYLNRTLCVHYGLPLQLGGWQEVSASTLLDWMHRGRAHGRSSKSLAVG